MRKFLAIVLSIVIGMIGLESLLWAVIVGFGLLFQSSAVQQGPVVSTDVKITGPSLLSLGRNEAIPITISHFIVRISVCAACFLVSWWVWKRVRAESVSTI